MVGDFPSQRRRANAHRCPNPSDKPWTGKQKASKEGGGKEASKQRKKWPYVCWGGKKQASNEASKEDVVGVPMKWAVVCVSLGAHEKAGGKQRQKGKQQSSHANGEVRSKP